MLILNIDLNLSKRFLSFVLAGAIFPIFSSALPRDPQATISSENASYSRTTSQSKKYRIHMNGVSNSQLQQLQRLHPNWDDKTWSLAEIDIIIRSLMLMGGFSSVEVREGGPGMMEIIGQRVQKIDEIEIQGAHAIASNDILKLMSDNGLQKGSYFDRKQLINVIELTQTLYDQSAHLSSNIDVEFKKLNDSQIGIIFHITEGPLCEISELQFETSNEDLKNKLLAIPDEMKNKPLSLENLNLIRKRVNSIFESHRFLTAHLMPPTINFNADNSKARLRFVIENDDRYEFLFEGNRFWEAGSILLKINVDQVSGSSASPAADLAQRIRDLYMSYGFAAVQVTPTEKELKTLHKRQILFKIAEGPRFRIERINISGLISRPSSYYSEFIQDHSSELIGKGYYSRSDFDRGLENLRVELQNQGFLQAKINKVDVEGSTLPDTLKLNVMIDEGPLTQVQQIRFAGADSFSTNELLKILSIQPSSPLSLNELSLGLERIKDFYRQNGFLEMQILNEKKGSSENEIVRYNETNTIANIYIEIVEGPKIRVSEIKFIGNTFTQTRIIQHELFFKEGEILTQQKLDESTFRLQRLGLFSKVEIQTIKTSDSESDRRVVVEVAERDPGLFSFGIGVTNEQDVTTRGFIGLAYRNLGGTARSISGRVNLQYSTRPDIHFLENEINLSYTEPYIFDGHNKGRVNLTREQKFFDRENTTGKVIIQEKNNVGLLLDRDFTPHTKLTFTAWGFSNQRQFYRIDNSSLTTQNIAKTGPLLEYSTLDDPFAPKKGFYSFINAEYSDPVMGSTKDSRNWIQFIKFNGGAQHILPFDLANKRIRWVNMFRAGYLSNLAGKYSLNPLDGDATATTSSAGVTYGVPASESFFLGGRSTIRGFEPGERVPSVNQLSVGELRLFRMTGESEFFLVKSELRIPFFKELADLCFFYDGGAVFLTQTDVSLTDPYRDAAGVGLRLNTPIGAFVVEMGFKLDRKTFSNTKQESPGALHISFGTF